MFNTRSEEELSLLEFVCSKTWKITCADDDGHYKEDEVFKLKSKFSRIVTEITHHNINGEIEDFDFFNGPLPHWHKRQDTKSLILIFLFGSQIFDLHTMVFEFLCEDSRNLKFTFSANHVLEGFSDQVMTSRHGKGSGTGN